MAEIHKRKACLGCGHPQHSRECREMVMPGLPSDVDECGCVELTNINDIIDLCRRSGGCPKHPIPEPPGSASSSPDERAFCLQCRHHRRFHVGGFCEVCPGFTKDNHHDFVPADAETAEETVKRIASGDYPGAWKAGSAETLCRCGHPRFRHAEGGCSPCEIEEPEAPECIGFAEPEALECEHNSRQWDMGASRWRCTDCGFEPESPGSPSPPPRPPNAVAYATEGGAQFEIALSGDATVRAIDGALIITHASAVLAITQVRPMET